MLTANLIFEQGVSLCVILLCQRSLKRKREGFYFKFIVKLYVGEHELNMSFDKRQTNIAKGVALLMLLWHHLFYDSPEYHKLFSTLFMFDGIPIESKISQLCKICVAIFVFLSGFGLYKSWNKNKKFVYDKKQKFNIKHQVVFVKNHILKLMLNYWFVFLIFVPIGIIFARKFYEVYEYNVIFGVLDFFGLANLFNTPTMNITWWFMSAIILLYFLFPLIVNIVDWSPETAVVISVVMSVFPYIQDTPYVGKYFSWFFPFVLGIYFSKRGCFELLEKYNQSFVKRILLSGLMVILFAFLRNHMANSSKFDAIFAMSIVLFCFFILSRITVVNTVLEHLGIHSGSIFMFHTFIFKYYFKHFIYSPKYPILIFILLIVECYFISVIIEWLKRITGYKKMANALTVCP